jgi:hypothetical protein
VVNSCTKKTEVGGRRFFNREDSRAVGGFAVENEWVGSAAITEHPITYTMNALELPNSVDAKTLAGCEEVRRAYYAHEADVVGPQQRNLPFATQRERHTKLVAELPQMLPPTVSSKVAKSRVILLQDVRANPNLHLKDLQTLL